MREVLHRGISKKKHKWVYGFYSKLADRHYIQYFVEDEMCNGGYYSVVVEVEPESVGEYTGITDKTGKKVFEDDILRSAHHPEKDCIIVWHDGSFRFKPIEEEYYNNYLNSLCFVQSTVSNLKIIGNIHDNPELLKRTNKERGMADENEYN